MQAPTSATTKRVGNLLPKFWLKIASAQQAGQKTKLAFPLSSRATGSSVCHQRLPTLMIYQGTLSSYVPTLQDGKGQNPSGLLAICRSPKCMRAQSGGNDQIQLLCALQGIARGKDGATAMNSSCASVCFVASTHPVFARLITRTQHTARASSTTAPSELPENPPPDHGPPAPTTTTTDTPAASNPSSTPHTRTASTHYETSDHAAPAHTHRYWDNTSTWNDSTQAHRGSYSSYTVKAAPEINIVKVTLGTTTPHVTPTDPLVTTTSLRSTSDPAECPNEEHS